MTSQLVCLASLQGIKNQTGSIQIVANTPELEKRQYPYVVPVIDRTTEFFPDFALSVELPWGDRSYPIKN